MASIRKPRRSKRAPIRFPTYRLEKRLLSRGYTLVAGLDEVGRGPLAGPVVAGVVILPPRPRGHRAAPIRDSKQLTKRQREHAMLHIRKIAVDLAVGSSSSKEIDRIGIVPATRLAMRRALGSLRWPPSYLLLDAIDLPEVGTPQEAIIHGDESCLSIAAASIVAKVTRDRMMETEHTTYPGYGFHNHKGYATAEHLKNLRRLGPCALHRHSFAPIKGWKNRPGD